MKNLLIFLSAVCLIATILLLTVCRQVEVSELITIGNKKILEYCDQHKLPPTYGLVDIEKGLVGIEESFLEYGFRLFSLHYSIYTDTDKIFSIILVIDRKGEIREFWTMVDDESILLETLYWAL